VRDAATVALLRDADAGLEVYLLQRSSAAVFSPSAHVFPGGALDDGDRAQSMNQWCGAFDRGHSCPIAYYIAAIRESFEEAGLLLAYDAGGEMIGLDDPEVGAPKGGPRRFDTRFFAARAPEHQTASSDEIETTSGVWARPTDVLTANDKGEVELILPTRRSLEALTKYARVDDALAGVGNRK